MTGYFTRLAARTGIGGERTPSAAQEAVPSPFVTEGTVTFVAQSDRPAAPATLASPPAARLDSTPIKTSPADPLSNEIARSGPAESALHVERGPESVPSRHIAAVRPKENNRTVFDANPRVAMPTDPDLQRRSVSADTIAATETRIGSPAMVAPSAPAALTSRVADLPTQSAVEASPQVETEETHPATDPAPFERTVKSALPAQPDEEPVFLPAREEPPFVAAPSEQALPHQPNGSPRSRPSVAPSVRIGTVQVDVHAAPEPSSPPPQPMPPSPPLPRPPSLRRFYLRDG